MHQYNVFSSMNNTYVFVYLSKWRKSRNKLNKSTIEETSLIMIKTILVANVISIDDHYIKTKQNITSKNV